MTELGGLELLDRPEVKASMETLTARWGREWQPDAGTAALTHLLRYFNSEEFAQADRVLQW